MGIRFASKEVWRNAQFMRFLKRRRARVFTAVAMSVVLLAGGMFAALQIRRATAADGTCTGAAITKLELHEGSPAGALTADLLTNQNPEMTVEQEYYLVVDVTKVQATDDCWVSVSIPFWMTGINLVGGVPPKVGTVEHTSIDEVISWTPVRADGSGDPGDASPNYRPGGTGTAVYRLNANTKVANFSVSMKPDFHYYNGSGSQLVANAASQMSVAIGNMLGDAAGNQLSRIATNSITKKSTGWGGIYYWTNSWPTIAQGETARPERWIYTVAGSNDVLWERIEFDIKIPDYATINNLTYQNVTMTQVGVNPDGTVHYIADRPPGALSGGLASYLVINVTFANPTPSDDGTNYYFPLTNVKRSTYGDENNYFRTSAGDSAINVRVKNRVDLILQDQTIERFDWYGQRGVRQNSLIGAAHLATDGAASLPPISARTIHADFPNNAIVRVISLPKFAGSSETITVTTRSGVNWTGPLGTVATISSGPNYVGILNTSIPGVTSSEDSITSVTYNLGEMRAGFSSTPPSPHDSYGARTLTLYGSITDGQNALTEYALYPTGSNAANPATLTATATGVPAVDAVLTSGTSGGINSSPASIVAGNSTHVNVNYQLGTYPYGNSEYDYDPTFYLILPDGFSYANFTINGAQITGVDVTTAAAIADGKTIYQFASPPGTEAGIYTVDGSYQRVNVQYDLLTAKSMPPTTLNLAQVFQVGNKDFAAYSVGGNPNPSYPDTYGINGGRNLRGWIQSLVSVQELKAVTVDNSISISSDGGASWSDPLVYNPSDSSTIAFMRDGTIGKYKMRITNQTGSDVINLSIFVPIPKTGRDFGLAFQNSPFEFDLYFTNDYLPAGFSTTYLKMNAGVGYDVGQVPAAGDYTVVGNPADADMVMITAASMTDGSTVEATLNVDTGGISPSDYGKVDIWNAVPKYQAGDSIFVPVGYPEAVEILDGEIRGVVYRDHNGSGTQDPGEPGIAGVSVRAADNFTPARIMTTTTDANGGYVFSNLRNTSDSGVNSGIRQTITIENPLASNHVFSPVTSSGNNPSSVTAAANQSYGTATLALTGDSPSQQVNAGLAPARQVNYVASTGISANFGQPSALSEDLYAGWELTHIPTVDGSNAIYGYDIPTLSWTANSAVTLDGAVVPAGATITPEQLDRVKVLDNVTFTASLQLKTYTVVFVDGLGGTLETQTGVVHGTAATTPEDPTRSGYTFSGWDEDFSNVTSDMTITAQWEVNHYKITYEPNWGYGAMERTEVTYDHNAALAENILTYEGHRFLGWTTKANGMGKWYFDRYEFKPYEIAGDLKLYAQWERLNFKVTFMDGVEDGDEGVIYVQTVGYNSPATAPSDLTREGYTFSGWDEDFRKVTSDLVVTAQWKINVYTVRFIDGNTEVGSEAVEWNEKATAPKDPEREGWTFRGWYTDRSYGTKYDFKAPVTSDKMLYAKWDEIPKAPNSGYSFSVPDVWTRVMVSVLVVVVAIIVGRVVGRVRQR